MKNRTGKYFLIFLIIIGIAAGVWRQEEIMKLLPANFSIQKEQPKTVPTEKPVRERDEKRSNEDVQRDINSRPIL